MKRFTALLALVVVLMAGMAGLASADTLTFDSFPQDDVYTLGLDPNTPHSTNTEYDVE